MTKYSISLHNVSIQAVNEKYGFIKKKEQKACDKTLVTDIIKEEHTVTFLDEKKQNFNCVATMIDIKNKDMKILPKKTDMSCFWCRHGFDTQPIGCPIKYVNGLVEKSYISNITREEYYMKENIPKTRLEKIKNSDLSGIGNIKITYPDKYKTYYLTDGIFCSFNCALSYITDNKNNPLYRESKTLLRTLCKELTMNDSEIVCAPDWRLLKEYGGHMDIDDFRENTKNYEFIFYITDVESSALMKPVSKIFNVKEQSGSSTDSVLV